MQLVPFGDVAMIVQGGAGEDLGDRAGVSEAVRHRPLAELLLQHFFDVGALAADERRQSVPPTV